MTVDSRKVCTNGTASRETTEESDEFLQVVGNFPDVAVIDRNGLRFTLQQTCAL